MTFVTRSSQFLIASADRMERYPINRLVASEIEVGSACRSRRESYINNAISRWGASVVVDCSLPDMGFEINTCPASGDIYHDQIFDICGAVKKQRGAVDDQCGLHVHVDARDYTWLDVRKLIFLYSAVEPALYSMVDESRLRGHNARPCGEKLYNAIKDQKRTSTAIRRTLRREYWGCDSFRNFTNIRRDKYYHVRYSGLNLHSWAYRGTMEFRHHQGTINPKTITDWTAVCASLVEKAKTINERELRKFRFRRPNLNINTTMWPLMDKDALRWSFRRLKSIAPEFVKPYIQRKERHAIAAC